MFQASGRDGLGIGGVVEYLNGDVALIADFVEGFEDGTKVCFSESGTAAVGVVGVNVGDQRRVLLDQLIERFTFRAGAFYVEDRGSGGVVQSIQQLARFFQRQQEVGFRGRKRLQADGDSAILRVVQGRSDAMQE